MYYKNRLQLEHELAFWEDAARKSYRSGSPRAEHLLYVTHVERTICEIICIDKVVPLLAANGDQVMRDIIYEHVPLPSTPSYAQALCKWDKLLYDDYMDERLAFTNLGTLEHMFFCIKIILPKWWN